MVVVMRMVVSEHAVELRHLDHGIFRVVEFDLGADGRVLVSVLVSDRLLDLLYLLDEVEPFLRFDGR